MATESPYRNLSQPCRHELRVAWAWTVAVGGVLEKKKKSKLLDSEMLIHANPGWRA